MLRQAKQSGFSRAFVNQQAFTLVELIMVIAILGILVVMAIPIYQNVVWRAYQAQAQGISSEIRAGITLYFAKSSVNPNVVDAYPQSLDVAQVGECDAANPCFGLVMQYPINNQTWRKLSQSTYEHTKSGVVCNYDASVTSATWGNWNCN